MRYLLGITAVCFILFRGNVYCQNDDEVRTVALKNGAIKISLPLDWERKAQDESVGINSLFIRNDPSGFLEIGIPLQSHLLASNDKFQAEFLKDIKKSIKDKGLFCQEDASFFNFPVLISSFQSTDRTQSIRDLNFIKNGKHYNITFGCQKSYFDEQWEAIESRIKSIEFLD